MNLFSTFGSAAMSVGSSIDHGAAYMADRIAKGVATKNAFGTVSKLRSGFGGAGVRASMRAITRESNLAYAAYTDSGRGIRGAIGLGAGLWTRPGFRYGTYGAAGVAGLGMAGGIYNHRRGRY